MQSELSCKRQIRLLRDHPRRVSCLQKVIITAVSSSQRPSRKTLWNPSLWNECWRKFVQTVTVVATPKSRIVEVTKRSVNNFRPLRWLLDDYYTFNVEASSCLENVFQRHESKGNNLDRVSLSRASVWPMITTKVLMWLKCINRRMLATPKARDPWCIEIKRDLPQEIFSHIKDAIRKGVSAFGVSVEDSVVKFTHRNGLFHVFQSRCTCGWGQAFYNLFWSQANEGYAMPLWIVEWIWVWISWLRHCMIWLWYAWEEQVMGDWHPRQCHVAIYCKINWVCFLLYTIEQVCFRSVFLITSSQGGESCWGWRFYFSSKFPPRGTEWLKSGQVPSCGKVYFPFWVHSLGKFVSQMPEGGTGQILREMPHVYLFPCV